MFDRIGRAVIGNPFGSHDTVEMAEERIRGVYEGIVKAIASHNARNGVIDTRIVTLANALDMTDEIREQYRPLVERILSINGPDEIKGRIRKFAGEMGL